MIKISLNNSGGELDSVRIYESDDKDDVDISRAIKAAMSDWILAPGDTIKIEEVSL